MNIEISRPRLRFEGLPHDRSSHTANAWSDADRPDRRVHLQETGGVEVDTARSDDGRACFSEKLTFERRWVAATEDSAAHGGVGLAPIGLWPVPTSLLRRSARSC